MQNLKINLIGWLVATMACCIIIIAINFKNVHTHPQLIITTASLAAIVEGISLLITLLWGKNAWNALTFATISMIVCLLGFTLLPERLTDDSLIAFASVAGIGFASGLVGSVTTRFFCGHQ